MDLQFGAYRLKRRERLLHGPDGAIDLSARAFDILDVLLREPGELVDKAALLDAVWPGVTVEENVLQVHVSSLRKVLDPAFIVTVHGRGYKYAGPPPTETDAAAPPPAVAAADRKPVVVVLPFENLSGDPEQQYFSDGITGDITDLLARFRVFSVIGQHSAARFRAAAPDFAAIRERLKADFVVTGSFRRADGRIRFAVRLSDAASEAAIWAERYDRPVSDLFSLQDEISELVAAAIARHLEIEINVRSSGRPHASLSSYEHMLQGYWHFKKLTRAGSLAAHQCFERAVALDPRNAEALGWLGVTYCESWIMDFSEGNAIKGAALSGQAIALDPANSTCHAIHAWTLLCTNDREGAVRTGRRGVVLNPCNPAALVNCALALAYDGSYAEARGLFSQARRLEPLPPPWFGEFEGVAAFAEGDYATCLAGVEPIPEPAWDVMYALACYGHLGQRDKAAAAVARLPDQGRNIDFMLGVAHEPFRDPEVRERLTAGLRIALSW